jgi:hypothetical protein
MRAPALLLAAALALALAAGILLLAAGASSARVAESETFQRLVGGIGLGPTTDLSRCGAEFDPRTGSACSLRHEPVACGSRFCPAHAGD